MNYSPDVAPPGVEVKPRLRLVDPGVFGGLSKMQQLGSSRRFSRARRTRLPGTPAPSSR